MQLTLCNFSKRLNSTKQPTTEQLQAGKTFTDVNLKQLVNIDNPDLVLAGAKQNEFAYNYAYIHDWGRYYHIKTCDLRHEDVYHAKLELDDLATFKAQILNTDAYIVYSSTGYNRWLRDDRVPILPRSTSSSTTGSLKENQLGTTIFSTTNEVVIVSVINKTNGLCHYVMTESDLIDVMAAVSNANQSIWQSLSEQFGAAINSIVQVIRLPIAMEALPLSEPWLFELGDYIVVPPDPEQPAFSFPILTRTYLRGFVHFSLPVSHLDFRCAEPYTQLKCAIPFVGTIDLNFADFRNVEEGDAEVHFRATIDLLTGAISYEIDAVGSVNKPIASYSGSCGMYIPFVASQIANAANVVQSTAAGLTGLAMSAATANPIPAVVGGIQSIAGTFFTANQKSTSVLGAYSGNRSGMLRGNITLTAISYDTSIEPSNLTEYEGRPVCKVDTIGNYSGYVKTQGFSIDIDANSDVVKSINSKLDAGIYIE